MKVDVEQLTTRHNRMSVHGVQAWAPVFLYFALLVLIHIDSFYIYCANKPQLIYWTVNAVKSPLPCGQDW